MNFFFILFFIAVAHAEASKRSTVFLPPIRKTIVRPAVVERVIQPVIRDVVQPIVQQKTIQTIVNPVRIENRVASSVNRPVQILSRTANPVRIESRVVSSVNRPAKILSRTINPVRIESRVVSSVNRPVRTFRNKFIKRAAVVESNETSTRFLGEWKFVSSDDNFDALMKELGVGFFTRLIAVGQKPNVRFELNGNEWTFTTTSTFKTTVLRFTIGKEFDEETPDGRNVKTTFTFDDGKLVQTQKDGGKIVCVIVREILNGDQMKTLAKAGSIESVRMYSKL